MKPEFFYAAIDKDGSVVQTFPENTVMDYMFAFTERILVKNNPADAPYSLWMMTEQGWFEQKESRHKTLDKIQLFNQVEPDHKMRCREAAQKIIDCIGSCGGPESLEAAVERATSYIESLRKENKQLINSVKL